MVKKLPHIFRWKMDAGEKCADCGKTREDPIHIKSKAGAVTFKRHPFKSRDEMAPDCSTCGHWVGHEVHRYETASEGPWYDPHPFEPDPSNELQCAECGTYEGSNLHQGVFASEAELGAALTEDLAASHVDAPPVDLTGQIKLSKFSVDCKIDDLQALMGPEDRISVVETPDETRPVTRVWISDDEGRSHLEEWTPEFTEKVTQAIRTYPFTDPRETIRMVKSLEEVGADFDSPAKPGPADPGEGECSPNFEEWWTGLIKREAPVIHAKAIEYGTNSLVEVGRLFARAQGWTPTDLEAIEIGCFVYAYGKMQRVADAMLKGRLPKPDSWLDLMVYSAMSLYARDEGHWP